MLLHLTLDFGERRFRGGTDIGADTGRMHGPSEKREIQRITVFMLVGIFLERSVEQNGIRRIVFQEPV